MPDPQTLSTMVAALERSSLFDVAFYEAQTGVPRALADGLEHYLRDGERAGLRPSRAFDPAFYGGLYTDVVAAGSNRLEHYVLYGASEARYPSRAALRADADRVRSSDRLTLIDPSSAEQSSRDDPAVSILESHLAGGWRHAAPLFRDFDDQFYFRAYERARASGLPPVIDYLEFGFDEGLIGDPAAVEYWMAAIRETFDPDFYVARRGIPLDREEALLDYVTDGWRLGFDPSPTFSVETYLRVNPDIAASGMEPFAHYVMHGRAENRRGRSIVPRVQPGGRAVDHDLPTLMLVTHEASRTGAPLVVLALARELRARYNLIIHTAKDGEIADSLRRCATALSIGALESSDAEAWFRRLRLTDDLAGVVTNSAETHVYAEGALRAGVPTVSLVHEFAEYSMGHVANCVEATDVAVFPAKLLQASAARELRTHGMPNNTTVRHQGWLEALPAGPEAGADIPLETLRTLLRSGGRKVVLGAGWSQIRKGLDLFVQTAATVRETFGDAFTFVWVGGNYDPYADMAYSVYVDETVERLDLRDRVVFLPEQTSLDALLAVADVFYLPSRLDPFPNVVLDALQAGLPVVCFEKATGSAELFGDGTAVGAAVPYCDTNRAAAAIVGFFADAAPARRNTDLIRTQFTSAAYASFVSDQLTTARTRKAAAERAIDDLRRSGVFDPLYHEGGAFGRSTRESVALSRYVARTQNGLSVFNPRPGFSDNLYLRRVGLGRDARVTPLHHAVVHRAGARWPATHDCINLRTTRVAANFDGRVAMHVHADTEAALARLSARLVGRARDVDLVVTVATERLALDARYALREHERGETVVEVVGRRHPMAALLHALRTIPTLSGCTLLGHVHDVGPKRLSRFVGYDVRGWMTRGRTMLFENEAARERIISMFVDPKLGLVFGEDHQSFAWGDLARVRDGLREAVRVDLNDEGDPFFPPNGLFWARPEVLVDTLDMERVLTATAASSPAERSPEGEVLVRLLPDLCNAAGLAWRTVHEGRPAPGA